MRTESTPAMSSAASTTSSHLSGAGLISPAQPGDFGWEDLHPVISAAAEQIDQELAAELQTAHGVYQEEPEAPQRRRLQSALVQTIDQLQADYQHVQGLKNQAEQRLLESRIVELSEPVQRLGVHGIAADDEFG